MEVASSSWEQPSAASQGGKWGRGWSSHCKELNSANNLNEQQ